jgi:UDP-N-acetylmuramyl pentapeptide synthase
MRQLELLLTQYETDVRFPDVSGMEHLDMLLTRSRIAAAKEELTPGQAERLLNADQHLLQNAEQFNRAIATVANLAEWRLTSVASPEEWWWYLDVLVSVPQLTVAN